MHIVPGMDIIYEVDAIVEAKVECSLYEIFTALSFLSVPLAFTYLGRKKKDPPRSLLRIFHMVSLFIAISGIVHLLNPFLANNNLIPIFQHILKMMVPICAILTSAAIYLLVPCIINMPSACQLQRLNTELKQLNMELQEHRDNLNREVAARTHELLQEQAKWKSIAEHAPQILWLKNKEGQMEFYNKRWYEYTGTDPSVVVGPCSRAVHPSDLEIMHQRWAEGGFSTQVSDYKIRIKAADNSYRWHLTRCVPIHDIDTGEVIQYVGISTDIHDTEIMSEISTADATRKSRFLAMISHEMRTPLTGIIGMATLLGDTALQAPQTDLLNNVKLSADKLLYLVNNILDLFKLHNDKLNLEITTFELHDCIQSALDTVSDEAGLKNITLHDDTEYDKLPTLIQADSTRLKQVLMNIYANAVKFTEEGGHIYTLASVEDEDNKKRIKISVQDTGIGIEQDNIFKVFETFSQVDSSSTRRFGGTGVGLAISKGLVELMRGNIWCESEPGKGATFHFTFEIEDVTNDTVRSDSRIPMASKPLLYASSCDDIMNSDGVIISDISSSDEESSHVAIVESPCITDDEEGSVCIIKPKVLIVDDTEMNQKVLKRYLTTLGYTDVDVVSDGAKAVTAVSNNRNYDVIFMDMEMPVMDGVTAAAQIRSLPLDKQPHIIAVTANAFQEDVQKCLDAGMCSHTAKPIKREDIKKKMDKAIQVLAGNETCTCHKANQLLHQHAKTPTSQLQHQQHENKTSTNQQSQQHDNTKLQMNQLSQQQTNTKSPTNQQPQIVQFQQEPQNQTIKPQPLQTQLRQTQQLHKPPSPPLQDPTLQQLFPQPPLELLHLLPLSPPPIQQPQINHNQLSHRHPTQQQNTHHQAN